MNRTLMTSHPVIQDILGLPMHTLATNEQERKKSTFIASHLWSSPIPAEGIQEHVLDIQVTSPLFTLLTLAPSLSEAHLAMALFEFTGTFSVFRPSEHIRTLLDHTIAEGNLPANFGWQQVHDTQGRPTDLWKRPPLIELTELSPFIDQTRGMRGHKKLAAAAKAVTGVVASPFEAQLSLLWGLTRRKGGKGLPPFRNNLEIPLTKQARLIYPHHRCYGDLVWDDPDGRTLLDVECQGAIAHDGEQSAVADGERLAALSAMGFDVVPISYNQILSPNSFDAITQLVFNKLGIKSRAPTEKERDLERKLRAQVFIDWNTLGEPLRK